MFWGVPACSFMIAIPAFHQRSRDGLLTKMVTGNYADGSKMIRQYDGNGDLLSEAFYDAVGNVYDNIDAWMVGKTRTEYVDGL